MSSKYKLSDLKFEFPKISVLMKLQNSKHSDNIYSGIGNAGLLRHGAPHNDHNSLLHWV